MDWLVIATFALIGGVIGSMLTKLISQTRPIGTLLIETSDPNNPYLLLELDKPIEDFYKDTYVTMKVKRGTYFSQK